MVSVLLCVCKSWKEAGFQVFLTVETRETAYKTDRSFMELTREKQELRGISDGKLFTSSLSLPVGTFSLPRRPQQCIPQPLCFFFFFFLQCDTDASPSRIESMTLLPDPGAS